MVDAFRICHAHDRCTSIPCVNKDGIRKLDLDTDEMIEKYVTCEEALQFFIINIECIRQNLFVRFDTTEPFSESAMIAQGDDEAVEELRHSNGSRKRPL